LDNILAQSALRTFFVAVSLALTTFHAFSSSMQSNESAMRIITLSPHLTEIVFALGRGKDVIAVSDYSDFPQETSELRSVASYEGANIAEIIRLKPTHILVWRGGNKDADIQKLKKLDVAVYESKVNSIAEFLADIDNIGRFINAQGAAQQLLTSTTGAITALQERYRASSKTAVYYLNTQPLVGLGNDRWLNSLLTLCGIKNVYRSSASAYPQLQMPDIIRKQPELLIAASKSDTAHIEQFWLPHKTVLKSLIVRANPDALHRFTPRAIGEITKVCDAAYSQNNQ
jgi:vitamin B12 transport system substrate-binding protein